MKEITLNSKNYLLVEVPDDAYDFKYKIMPDNSKQLIGTIKDEDSNIGTCYIKENPQGKIIGKISDILKDEDVCKELTKTILISTLGVPYYQSWNKHCNSFYKATNSFLSYLQSIDIDLTKQYLLIKKF